MIKIEESIKGLLEGISQEAVNFWCEIEEIESMNKEDFVSRFDDFTEDGLASLLTAISAAVEGIEKQEKDSKDATEYDIENVIEIEGNVDYDPENDFWIQLARKKK